jgi:hypothetical protein
VVEDNLSRAIIRLYGYPLRGLSVLIIPFRLPVDRISIAILTESPVRLDLCLRGRGRSRELEC